MEWYSQALRLTQFMCPLRASGYDVSPSTRALSIKTPTFHHCPICKLYLSPGQPLIKHLVPEHPSTMLPLDLCQSLFPRVP